MPWKPAAGGNGHRARAGSKSIRGQISGPIPIPDPLDEEFPMREQAVVIAGAGNDPSPDDASLAFQEPGSSNPSHQVARFRTASSSIIEPSALRQQSEVSSSGPALTTTTMRKSATPSSQLNQFSRISEQNDSRDNKPERKKSTIRSALSKLFGRKKKVEPKEKARLSNEKATSAKSSILPNKQHRSDPTWEKANQMSIETKRSFSMPITEYDRALRSHSIGPEDVMAIQSARNSVNVDLRLSGKNFVVFEPPAHPASPRWAGGSKLTGLSPRPASSQDRGTRMGGLSDDPSEIGRAISSDAHGLKRRSRSLSVMPSLELAAQGVVRRRSAEIRYWRESYAAPFMSPTSTTADDEIRQLLTDDPEESESYTHERPVTPEQIILVAPAEAKRGTPTPTKTTEHEEPMEHLSMDNRVGGLETRMSRLEGIVLQLGKSIPALRQPSSTQTRLPGPRQVQLQTPDHIIHSMQLQPGDIGLMDEPRQSTSRPSTRHSDASKMTFGDINESTPRATILSPADGEAHPGFLATPRGPDVTPRARAGSVTFEHYTNLLALLETERSAREALEAQVRSLGRQIQIMSKSMTYTNTDQSDSPSIDRSLGEVSVFDHDDDDDERRRLTATRFPYNGLGMEDSGFGTENRSDDEYTESFVTPVETGNNSFDVYGKENDPMLTSDGRKLSLSHLTMRQPLTAMQQVAANAV